MLYYKRGNENENLRAEDLKQGLYRSLDKIGPKKKVLVLPPDITRFHSQAGILTQFAWQYYDEKLTDILPANGTHFAMTSREIKQMFGDVPQNLFRSHDWRSDVVTLGKVPSEFVKEVSEGKVNYNWPAQVNRLLVKGGFDLILSIGQVAPHEVIGMANYNKNIFIGTGGAEGISKSHFLGAVYGLERIMGRINTPVRNILNYASEHFAQDLPIVYVLTVVAASDKGYQTRGLFIGDDSECFENAASLSQKVNIQLLDEPLERVVVYLDPEEYKSTWLGNKSIYRTRMVMADNSHLIIIAPGVKEFGEDGEINQLIRKYGYVGSEKILDLVEKNLELRNNLCAAAHLIHSSSEGRFKITYCPGYLTKEQVESVNFEYADPGEAMNQYNPKKLKDGFNTVNGKEIFFISNPGIGLWALRNRFK